MKEQTKAYQTRSNKKKSTFYWIIALVVVIITLLVLKLTGVIGSSDDIEVETAIAKKRDITETITASGKLKPEKEVAISTDVSGEIIILNFKENDRVKKGDLLLRIKPDEYISSLEDAKAAYKSSMANLENAKASLMQSEALMEQAKKVYDRYLKLKKEEAVSETEFENVKTEYLTANAQYEAAKQSVESAKYQIIRAKAGWEKAREDLNKTSIYAPMDGVVTVLNNELGERVVGTGLMQGSVIMKIADLGKMEVNVDVNENDIIRIHLGDTASIEVDAFIDRKFKGTVTKIANSSKEEMDLSEQITTYEVKIRILESSYEDLIDTSQTVQTPFRPGMSAMVDIQTHTKPDVLSVPILAVTTRKPTEIDNGKKDKSSENNIQEETEVVFILNNGKAELKQVDIGLQDDYFIEITSGISEGDEVVSGPYNIVSKILDDGQFVKAKQD